MGAGAGGSIENSQKETVGRQKGTQVETGTGKLPKSGHVVTLPTRPFA